MERTSNPMKEVLDAPRDGAIVLSARILLVDDDRELRDSVRQILTPGGYHVVEASDCESALFLLARERFDLILLDITLPDESGFRVLSFLKENHMACKVIVITGTVRLDNAIKSARWGVQDYITKPYNPRFLLESIENVLSAELRS